MLSETLWRSWRQLNTRLVAGRIPVINVLVFITQILSMAMLMRSFNSYYARKPILTTMVVNAVLGGIADTVAQTLTAANKRNARKATSGKDDSVNMEIYELDSKGSRLEQGWVPDSKRPLPSFDFERLTRFMAHGFFVAFFQLRWFGFLKKTFPITDKTATAAAFKRMALDQLIFAPVGLASFFTFMTLAEGGGRGDLTRKFRDVYVPSLKANYLLWPAVQMLNFRLIPIQFQTPLVSTVSIFWIAYLSVTNAAEDAY